MKKKRKGSETRGRRLNVGQLAAPQRRELLEHFARYLVEFLETPDSGLTKSDVLNRAGKKVLGHNIEVRQFENLLQALYQDHYLRIGFRQLYERSAQLAKRFDKLQTVLVVAGASEANFAEAAAEDLVRQLARIGTLKRSGKKGNGVLNVGIISGSTTGSVVRAAIRMDWSKAFGIDAARLPPVRVLALNVCLTVPKHLAGNSTILAYQLAEKIKTESGGTVNAEPYGLSAPLVTERTALRRIDEAPQTFDVVRITEPFRVKDKLAKQGASATTRIEESSTDLDVVLTGVGELPTTGREGQPGRPRSAGSLFYNLAKEFGLNMEAIVAENHIVGDVAFTAIRSDGEPVPLRRTGGAGDTDADGAEESDIRPDAEYLFYSAVQLPVLEKIAEDPNKAVILVARYSEEKDKVPAIFASIGGARHRYASRLIVDEQNGERLLRY